ncbi:MAG TPA: hydrogenase expression/formation protein HypE [Acidobacteriota bacterium]|nr:hydrogenase expression/formation protein HypE [Acidobacteriota bacterium]HNC45377.1 hydrogenase expression/formation protein HypE [Acidobacteriota bacterium]
MSKPLNFNEWTCPLPLRDHPNILMSHGGGGKLSAELVENLFLPAFGESALRSLHDSATLEMSHLLGNSTRLAFSTDSFVVKPLFFPGGNIGDLAVNGTVNDIAMSGAQALFLSTGFILEEGLAMQDLGKIASSMGAAALQAGVKLATGDTKVVNRGHGDGVYINTSGFGVIPAGVHIGPDQARPGDVVIVSGEIGVHGIAILSVREGLEFETVIETDCAPLNGLVAAMLEVSPSIHVLRDPTRGGLASSLNEIAKASQVGISFVERLLPVPPQVKSACEILGLDPVYVANEGKLLAIVPRDVAEPMLEAMKRHPMGHQAAIIGEVTDRHPGFVVAKTGIGGTRVVDMQLGEQLPRIC